jgi:hypothetical protein
MLRAPAPGNTGDQIRSELHRVRVPPALLVGMIGEAAGHAALGADQARPDVGKADLDAPILDPEVNRLHPPGVIEAEQTGVMRLKCVHCGTPLNRQPFMNRPRRATEIPEEPIFCIARCKDRARRGEIAVGDFVFASLGRRVPGPADFPSKPRIPMLLSIPSLFTPSLRQITVTVALVAVSLLGSQVSATPVALTAPVGLNPGDRFRFVFVTNGQFNGVNGTIDATSTDITTYNTFVNTEAGGATYGNAVVSWKAVGSTPTVNARDNVGGYGTSVPVYIVDGTRVANDLTTATGGFWSGRLLSATPRLKIDLFIDGTNVNSYTWTGSNGDGTAYSGYELGSVSSVYYGDSNSTGGFLDYDSSDRTYTAPMFAMSEELTVATAVPEIDPAGVGAVLTLLTAAFGLLERRRLTVA